MEREKKLIKNTLILGLGTIMTKGLNFIMAPLFTRWLSTEDYGMFDLLCTYATLLIPVIAMGTHHAVFRFMLDADTKNEKTNIVTNTVIINVIGAVIYLLLLSVLCVFIPGLHANAIALTLLLLAQTLQNYMCMYVRGIKRMKLYTVMNVIGTISIMLAVTVFVKVLSMGLNGIIFGYSIGYIVSMIFGGLVGKAYSFLDISTLNILDIKRILKYSFPMIPNSIAWWFVNISDRMIVSMTLGLSANAVLAVGHKIPNLCTTLYDSFQTAWIESASESIHDSDWNKYFENMLNLMGRVCMSISLIIVSSNFFVFELLFTGEYIDGKLLVPLFSLAVLFSSLSQTLGSVFIAEYDSKFQGISMIKAGALNIFLSLLLIKFVGLFAPAISALCAYTYLFTIRYKKIKTRFCIKFQKKTIILALITIIYTIFAYIDCSVMNILMFVLTFGILLIFNKEILLAIVKKIKGKLHDNQGCI